MTQDRVFSAGEGDRWFARNRAALADPDRVARDPVLRALELVGLTPKDALEIGAANGYRLAELARRSRCRTTAVEISDDAIRDGRARYPDIEFLSGLASDLPVESGRQFDLVIVSFVLHWVDRSTLLRSAAEIDRVVCPLGHLVIADFLPTAPERVDYHHLPGAGVWTYKQDYPEIFLATRFYERSALLTYDADGVDAAHRCAVSVLRKIGNEGYRTARFTVREET
jgi:SAM-dependent methyltransferase